MRVMTSSEGGSGGFLAVNLSPLNELKYLSTKSGVFFVLSLSFKMALI